MPRPGPFRWLLTAVLALSSLLTAGSALALLSIDFEQPYYAHAGWQVWDFCIIEHDGLYRIYYLAVPEDDNDPLNSDHIWMSTSEDLRCWSEPKTVLSVSFDTWEQGAVWAPDVVYDEATQRWWMAYTGVALNRSQAIGMAWSTDLENWTKSAGNPVVQPTHAPFFYHPSAGWAECRDPYLYRQDDRWHMLATVKVDELEDGRGALLHTSSDDLETWSQATVFLRNDSETPGAALESSQYHQITGGHHLFCHEYGYSGVTWFGTLDPEVWSLADRVTIDLGIAPEVDTFDDGETWLLSRCAAYREPVSEWTSVVIRIDPLGVRQGAVAPTVFREDPWARDFASHGGSVCLGNPCFGDNPAARGEEPAGTVGWGYLGTREYNRGPLSNRGASGIQLGDTATGYLDSKPFVVEGRSMRFLMGGSNQPDQCFMALMDAEADTILRHATGHGHETMIQRWWDISALQGRTVYLHIEDSSLDGYLNLDEIHEMDDDITATPTAPSAVGLHDLGPSPNPFNPRTSLRFTLDQAASVAVTVYDPRGRRVWTTGVVSGRAGRNTVDWSGTNLAGQSVPGGLYLYRIITGGGLVATGKLTLLP